MFWNKFVNFPKKVFGEAEKMGGLYATSVIVKGFNAFVEEIDKALDEGSDYSNAKYWGEITHKINFDSPTDKQFCRDFQRAIKTKTIRQWHLDYLQGTGKYVGHGLRDYVLERKKDILLKALNKWGVKEKELHEKAEGIKKNAELTKEKLSKKDLQKYEKQVEKLYKEVD